MNSINYWKLNMCPGIDIIAIFIKIQDLNLSEEYPYITFWAYMKTLIFLG